MTAGRGRLIRAVLLLLLPPQAAAVVWLASRPDAIQFARVDLDGSHATTGTQYQRDKYRWQVRVFDVRSGTTRYLGQHIADPELFWRTGNRAYVAEDDQTKAQSVVFVDEQLAEVDRVPIDPIGTIQQGSSSLLNAASANYVACSNTSAQLTLVDLHNRSTCRIALPKPANYFWSPRFLATAGRLLMLEMGPPMQSEKGNSCLLLDISGPEAREIAMWSADSLSVVFEEGDKLYSITPDGAGLECRAIKTGALLSVLALAEHLSGPPPFRWMQLDGSMPVLSNQIEHIWYDVRQQQVAGRSAGLLVQSPMPWRVMARCDDYYVTREDATSIAVRDSAGVRFNVALPEQFILAVGFASPARQLITVQADDSVRMIDLETGETQSHHRRSDWNTPLLLGLIVSFSGWAWWWITVSRRCGTPPIWDLLVLHTCLMAALVTAAALLGNALEPTNAVFWWMLAQYASWICLFAFWLIFGAGRWSVRILGPIVVTAIALALVLITLGGDSELVGPLVLCGCGITAGVTLLLAAYRSTGRRLVPPTDATLANSGSTDRAVRVPLRDIFDLIAALALQLAVLRLVGFNRLEFRLLAVISVTIVTTSVTGFFTIWAVLGRSMLNMRLLILLAVMLVGSSEIGWLYVEPRTYEGWMILSCQVQFAIVVITAASLWLLRSRGWRLQ